MIYLDNSATTRAFDSVADLVHFQLTEQYFNASAAYSLALKNERLFNEARSAAAAVLKCAPAELYFTSGGTEGANTALFGTLIASGDRKHIIISEIEHPAVFDGAQELKRRGCRLSFLPVLKDGTVDAKALSELVSEDTALVSIMHVNNETGAVNDIEKLSMIIKDKNPDTLFHSDGVQAFLHVPTDINLLGVDFYSVSAHKIHGPKGMGALFVKKGTPFMPLLYGGGQQDNVRSGTINLPGIMGMVKAIEEINANKAFLENLKAVKSAYTAQLLQISDSAIIGDADKTAPQILSIGFEGIQAQVLQNALEEQGVIVGKGSACASKANKISRILQAMQVPPALAAGTIRISFGAFNTMEEVQPACDIMKTTVERLKKFKKR